VFLPLVSKKVISNVLIFHFQQSLLFVSPHRPYHHQIRSYLMERNLELRMQLQIQMAAAIDFNCTWALLQMGQSYQSLHFITTIVLKSSFTELDIH